MLNKNIILVFYSDWSCISGWRRLHGHGGHGATLRQVPGQVQGNIQETQGVARY